MRVDFFKKLYYLEGSQLAFIEVKRLDKAGEKDLSKVFYWLLWDKQTDELSPMTFRAMGKQDGKEKRTFQQGNLEFDEKTGRYTDADQNSYKLSNASNSDLTADLIEKIAAYLKAQD